MRYVVTIQFDPLRLQRCIALLTCMAAWLARAGSGSLYIGCCPQAGMTARMDDKVSSVCKTVLLRVCHVSGTTAGKTHTFCSGTAANSRPAAQIPCRMLQELNMQTFQLQIRPLGRCRALPSHHRSRNRQLQQQLQGLGRHLCQHQQHSGCQLLQAVNTAVTTCQMQGAY